MNGIVGTRWYCLACTDFNLCDRCHGVADHEHKMVNIEDPEDFFKQVEVQVCAGLDHLLARCSDKFNKQTIEDETDTVLLGLRVYTRQAKVSISGQLRHGHLLQWKKTSP